MNVVKDETGKELKTPRDITRAANALFKMKYKRKGPFTIDDFGGASAAKDRLRGNHCYCNGNGVFRLLPIDDEAVQSGGKRYMQCEKCGGWSHL